MSIWDGLVFFPVSDTTTGAEQLNMGEFHCCGCCLPQPHLRTDLSRDPKVASTSPLFSLQLAWENFSVLKQLKKVPSLCVS